MDRRLFLEPRANREEDRPGDGSWGFEQGHYDVSMKSGDLALLPAVRKAEHDTIVIANGFSCKTQIQQSDAGRNALHVAQVMKMAREHGPQGYRGGAPEEPYYEIRPRASVIQRAARLGGAGAMAAGGLLILRALLRARR